LKVSDQSRVGPPLDETWKYSHTISASVPTGLLNSLAPQIPIEQALVALPRIKLTSSEAFRKILEAGKPVILEKSNIGPCSTKWTREYLKAQVAADREVSPTFAAILSRNHADQIGCRPPSRRKAYGF